MAVIDAVFVAVYRHDLRLARCCVASIRRWHPDVPIRLLKDEAHGPFDTTELERHFGVEVRPEHVGCWGWGMSKLVPLTVPTGERVLVLDADIVLLGPVLDRLAAFDEDMVVSSWDAPDAERRAHYFVPEALRELAPTVPLPGTVFNGGQFVARTGILPAEEVAEWVTPGPLPRVRHPEVFHCGEQGIVNFLVHRAAMEGRITVAHDPFMWWGGSRKVPRIRPRLLPGPRSGVAAPVVMHWAGPKPARFVQTPNGHVLRYYERMYHRQLPAGRRTLWARRLRREWELRTGRAPSVRVIEPPPATG